ncbi:MAG: ribosomal RNA small subunit methyltransferase A [Proteobacteria bacterium]|nr:ribosomal RNA small subunit methyltransferase A [Pseudomonadota bacterium]
MTSPRHLLTAWDLKPDKNLGQNFLIQPATSSAIVKACGISSEDSVLEIGAGLGALTLPLSKAAKEVFAVEKDGKLVALLKNELALNPMDHVHILEASILTLDLDFLLDNVPNKIIVAGNLPYNISSQILIRLMAFRHRIKHAVVMLQKELALRIMEPPGSRQYGRISVMLQYCAEIQKVMDVRADQFFPKPRIDSLVLMIRFKATPDFPAKNEDFLFKVIKAAFGQRRKTLKNALQNSELQVGGEMAEKTLVLSGIDPKRRAETLSVEEFVRLSNTLETSS